MCSEIDLHKYPAQAHEVMSSWVSQDVSKQAPYISPKDPQSSLAPAHGAMSSSGLQDVSIQELISKTPRMTPEPVRNCLPNFMGPAHDAETICETPSMTPELVQTKLSNKLRSGWTRMKAERIGGGTLAFSLGPSGSAGSDVCKPAPAPLFGDIGGASVTGGAKKNIFGAAAPVVASSACIFGGAGSGCGGAAGVSEAGVDKASVYGSSLLVFGDAAATPAALAATAPAAENVKCTSRAMNLHVSLGNTMTPETPRNPMAPITPRSPMAPDTPQNPMIQVPPRIPLVPDTIRVEAEHTSTEFDFQECCFSRFNQYGTKQAVIEAVALSSSAAGKIKTPKDDVLRSDALQRALEKIMKTALSEAAKRREVHNSTALVASTPREDDAKTLALKPMELSETPRDLHKSPSYNVVNPKVAGPELDLQFVINSGMLQMPQELLDRIMALSWRQWGRDLITEHLPGCLSLSSCNNWKHLHGGLALVDVLMDSGDPTLFMEMAKDSDATLLHLHISRLEYNTGTVEPHEIHLIRAKAAEVLPKLLDRFQQHGFEAPLDEPGRGAKDDFRGSSHSYSSD